MAKFRIGLGFDVHAFSTTDFEDNKIILGGMQIPCKYKIIAHSDGDVVLHAVTDAILGALALGDIGDHFPPTNQEWRNANSALFLKHAASLIKNRDWNISNIDIVIMCEIPKLMPYKNEMAKTIAEFLELDLDAVSIKATTTEKLGFTGREEGIAVTANCLIYQV